MGWTRKTVAVTALGTVRGFGVVGGGAAYAMTSGHSTLAASSALTATAKTAKTTPPASAPAPVPTETVTVAPQTPPPAQTPLCHQPSSAPAHAPAQPQFTSASAVVAQYYLDITNHDYPCGVGPGRPEPERRRRLWRLGGRLRHHSLPLNLQLRGLGLG